MLSCIDTQDWMQRQVSDMHLLDVTHVFNTPVSP
jgi:hypothetical protein